MLLAHIAGGLLSYGLLTLFFGSDFYPSYWGIVPLTISIILIIKVFFFEPQ